VNGLPERELTRCNEFKALTARGDGPKGDAPCNGYKNAKPDASCPGSSRISSIQPCPGEFDEDETETAPDIPLVDTNVEDVHRMMLLTKAQYGNADYMLKDALTLFVSSLSVP
jgi:hypothetical protein